MVISGILALRTVLPERGLEDVGPRALLDSLFSLLLLAIVLYASSGIGRKAWSLLAGPPTDSLENRLFRLALGLGLTAYGVLALGLAGVLSRLSISLWLILLVLLFGEDHAFHLRELKRLTARLRADFNALAPLFKPLPILCGLILLLALLVAFAPPSDYDGLMYHLRGPQVFLQSGRINLIDGIWQANGPFTLEMLFAIGLAFGSDTFAQLLHFSYLILLLGAVIGFARKHLQKEAGWVGAVILLGIPILPFLASRAHTDFGWALYEFLGVWALVNGIRTSETRWLSMAGIMMGFAMGVKYLALGGTALMCIWIFLEGKADPPQAFKAILRFILPAALIASPWYLKNWLLSGNPFYPFYLPTENWDAARIGLLMTYLKSFGTGHSAVDYLLLPVRLYTDHIRFTTFSSIDAPGFLFPLGLIYLFRRDHPLLNRLALYSLAWAALWACGSQQVRFLIPIYPLWAMITAHVLLTLPFPALKRAAVAGLCSGLLMLTLIYQGTALLENPPVGVLSGRSSKSAYLLKAVKDYGAVQYVRQHIHPGEMTLLLWDGQSYYCGDRCIPDSEEDRWIRLTANERDVANIAAELKTINVGYLLLQEPEWHILYHDPFDLHEEALEFLTAEFLPACGRQVYSDPYARVFELICEGEP